jgi:hypothetical protein
MSFIRKLNTVLCYIPFIWVLSFFLMVLIGIIRLNKIPVYGVDPDPSALSFEWINWVNFLSMGISFLSIPANYLLAIVLIADKEKFSLFDKISLFVPILSIGIFFICKHVLTNLFYWALD